MPYHHLTKQILYRDKVAFNFPILKISHGTACVQEKVKKKHSFELHITLKANCDRIFL